MYCWGYGNYFVKNYEIIEKIYGVIEGVIDNNASKWGPICHEKCKCLSPDDVPKGAEVLITVENKKVCEEIRKDVLNYGFLEVEPECNMQQKKKSLMLCGTIDECQKMHYLLNRNDSNYAVNYYITPFAEELGINNIYDVPIISVFMAERLMQTREADFSILVIADQRGFDFSTRKIFHDAILKLESFFVAPKELLRECYNDNKKYNEDSFMVPYSKQLRVGILQFMVTAKCNLNCKWCTHFAGIVEEDEYYSQSEFKKDMMRAREIFDDTDSIDIWGGEALLCDFLPEALYTARKLWEKAAINLGTNGLLVLDMTDELVQAIRETNTRVIVSMYPPTTSKLEKIVDFFRANSIEFSLGTGRMKIDTFFVRYDLEGKNNIKEAYQNCNSRYCTTIYKGKLCACYFPIAARFYNRAFGEEFEVDHDVIDIHNKDLNKEEIIHRLRTPMQSCRYCSPRQYKTWEQIQKRVKNKYDWVIENINNAEKVL